jgi:predicted nucleotidyltransferase
MGVDVAADSTLQEIVARIVRTVDPDRIILFGSRAAGRARARSDYDLMIVKASDLPLHRRLRPVYQALYGIPASSDVLWYTPAEVDDWAGVETHVIGQAARKGQIVYAKDPA